jgi:Na+-transporting methylmalonyl-CoA/oxaloacetate decarboxylase gamma subunit
MNIIIGIFTFFGIVFVAIILLFLIAAMIVAGRYDKDDEQNHIDR